jgi:hypothetical protein
MANRKQPKGHKGNGQSVLIRWSVQLPHLHIQRRMEADDEAEYLWRQQQCLITFRLHDGDQQILHNIATTHIYRHC